MLQQNVSLFFNFLKQNFKTAENKPKKYEILYNLTLEFNNLAARLKKRIKMVN